MRRASGARPRVCGALEDRIDALEAHETKVGIVVLAAGASTRMGEPKQLLRFGGESLLRRAAEQALGSVCRPVVVVIGAHAALMRNEIADLPLLTIENPSWASGMGSSIRAGVAALAADRAEIGAVVITVCDQPFVTAEVIDQLVGAHRSMRAEIVAAEYAATLGVPALFSRRRFAELLALDDAGGAKQIIARRAAEVCRVRFARGVFDIDTPEDYVLLRRGETQIA